MFTFHIFVPLANLWFIRLQELVSHPKASTRSSALQEDHWNLIEGESFPGIRPVPFYVSRLRRCPLSSARRCSRDFPFTEDETRRHFSYLSSTVFFSP